MAGNPVPAVAGKIGEMSGGRKTALALILAIIFAEMLLSGRVQEIWKALWGPTKPLALTSQGKK